MANPNDKRIFEELLKQFERSKHNSTYGKHGTRTKFTDHMEDAKRYGTGPYSCPYSKQGKSIMLPARTLVPCIALPGSRVKLCTVFSSKDDAIDVHAMLALAAVNDHDRHYVGVEARKVGFSIDGWVIAVFNRAGLEDHMALGFW